MTFSNSCGRTPLISTSAFQGSRTAPMRQLFNRRLATLAAAVLTIFGIVSTALAGSGGKSKAEKWDVAAQHGPADTTRFTVNEGTWMNLDVSPDGGEIVFDLLGDIYIMPISGGKAHLLAGGLPYEVQPRFSPDGKMISFTSDRAGGDNIWVMQRDGSQPHAVTAEDFRLLNNAVWTTDGQYLIAKKHFTSTRSLGAGEMWLYHVSGGEGLQLTKRKNDQQDVGEPCISPEGRYLYFSEDMSGGSTFQYNKDPNGRIYVIRRLDLQTGKLINYIDVQGGSVRPQASPDGKYLSFVRRVRTKSVLYVYEISSGEMWPVYDQLSKDQQETWATFGVYPGYSWMPGSREVVIWARGHLWRIDVFSKNTVQIPFEVEAVHSLTRPPLFRQAVGQKEFTAKMIRQTTTSPDGRWVVFNAVGHLWKMPADGGTPQRLTNDQDHFEFEPAFSPDSRWIVYTVWNDSTLGAIYKIAVRGGRPVKLTPRKGYYYTPRFSPDGRQIVYLRDNGNSLLGYAYGVDPGIYIMPADGGAGSLVVEEGSNPQFSRDGRRIYFFEDEGDKKFVKSVLPDGGDPRTLFTSTYATEVAISPDEKWVAFQELFNVYITPFPQTGGAIDLSSKSKAIPLKKVTRDAGTYLHWSGDSRKLHWTIGPQYFTRDLHNTFSFLPGAPDSIPGPDTTGVDINLTVPADVPTGKLALVGARIITMNGDEVIEDGVIVTDQNRITAVGKNGEVAVPADARKIDVSGKTIMPGMVDVHAHVNHFTGGMTAQQNWAYMANLAFGVTTTHDPSATTDMVFSQAELVRAGLITGPRIFSTGTILYGAEGDFKAVVNSLDDARSHLRRMKAVGAFSVKSYNQPRRNQRQQILQAARELKMMVYPEGGSFFFHNMNMVIDGHTGIEHSIPVSPLYDDVIKLWSAGRVGYTPTLIVSYGGLWGENYWYQHTEVWKNRRLLNFVPRRIIDSRSIRRTMAPDEQYGFIENARAARALADAGVRVNLGAHGQLQGLGAHWELWMLVQGGMTPLQAIRCATLNGAHYIGMDEDLGSLQNGKLADLVVMEKNPLEDIRNSESILYVMKNGRLYDAETLNEIGNHQHKRHRFYYENPRTSDAGVWEEETGINAVRCGCERGR